MCVVMAKTSVPEGLHYWNVYEHRVDTILLDYVEEWLTLEETQAMFNNTSSNPNSRRVLQFGSAYNYRKGATIHPALAFEDYSIINDLKDETQNFLRTHELESAPNQCIINEYLPGQGITAHVDDTRLYGDVIACWTFGSQRQMRFTHKVTKDVHVVDTVPFSLYVMSGESRYNWTHEMRPRLSDKIDGNRVKRGTTYSITFRSTCE